MYAYLLRISGWLDSHYAMSGYGEKFIVFATHLMTRALNETHGAFLSCFNMHNVFAASVYITIKAWEDKHPGAKEMGFVLGLDWRELVAFERGVLGMLGWVVGLETNRMALRGLEATIRRKHEELKGRRTTSSPSSGGSTPSIVSIGSGDDEMGPDFEIGEEF
jgi:hypothetical protein